MFRVHDELKDEYVKIASTPGEVIVAKGLLCPRLNEGVKMEDVAALNAVYEKIVAVESCRYVLEVLFRMQSHIQIGLNTPERKMKLKTFWTRNNEAIDQLSRYMYLTHPIKSIKVPMILPSISS